MLQSLTTLLFTTLTLVATGLIAALMAEDWRAVRRALGLGEALVSVRSARRTRLVAVRRVPVLLLRPVAMRRAA